MVNPCVALVAILMLFTQPALADLDVRGGWQPELFELKTGERHAVSGLIVFTASEWTLTLFYTSDGEEPQRAVAEGGTYTIVGSTMAMKHLYRFSAGKEMSGLADSPLRMEVDRQEAPLEPIMVKIEVERLTLSFPSGNKMTFRRSSRF